MKEEKYDWHKATHDKTPYGKELAKKVADYLEKGGAIGNVHRDYCGMGLIAQDNIYYYCSIFDGYFLEDDIRFTKEDFIDWLAVQNDYTMSLKEKGNAWDTDNQVITKERLVNLPNPIELDRILSKKQNN